MTRDVHVRLATAADAPVLARLRYDFRAAVNEPTETREEFVARCLPWMRARLESGSWRAWVATGHSGEVVGNLWLTLVEKLPNPGTEAECHAYISNVYVSPGARGEGTGQALLDAALAFCREAGVDSAILWPTQQSRTLYARNGFQSPGEIMEAIITPGRDLH